MFVITKSFKFILYIYLANLFYYFILYQYMCITLNVYIDLYIVQHHRILLYKYGVIEIININISHTGLTVIRIFRKCVTIDSTRRNLV